jgi:hypothetical protein
MTFATLATHLKKTSQVVAFDFRGHGKNRVTPGDHHRDDETVMD